MSTLRWACPAAVALALLAGAAAAQPSPIKQGFDAAWARQPEQRAGAARRDAAAAGLDAANRWTPEPPALEVSGKSDRLNRNNGVREYDAMLAVPLWLPGERGRAQAAASAESGALDSRLLAAQWRIAAEVREAWWALRRARLDHELAVQRLANAQQLASDVARRVKAGDLARADGHQAESSVAAAQSAVAEAEVGLTQAALAWRALTGTPVPEGALGEPRPSASAEQAAHPALREWSARADVARKQRELAAAQKYANPELTIGAVRERDSFAEQYGQSIVVGLRIPLGSSSTSQSRQATASAEQMEAEAQLELETQRVRAHAEAAQARLRSLETAQAAAERRAALARESRGFFEKAFRLGESDLPTRLRIELEASEAERQAARSRVEVDAAISQLRQALGLLPE